jgi:hypothetical protein
MTPAAYTRQTGSREVSESFIRICTRLLLVTMAPLALGICLDVYLIARVIAGGWVGAVLASSLLAVFMILWFVVPRAKALQHMVGGGR